MYYHIFHAIVVELVRRLVCPTVGFTFRFLNFRVSIFFVGNKEKLHLAYLFGEGTEKPATTFSFKTNDTIRYVLNRLTLTCSKLTTEMLKKV